MLQGDAIFNGLPFKEYQKCIAEKLIRITIKILQVQTDKFRYLSCSLRHLLALQSHYCHPPRRFRFHISAEGFGFDCGEV